MTKNIRVDESVHRQVKRIADANFRGMGDQVAYWAAMDCPHPIELRDEKFAHVVGTNEKISFFYCPKCKRHIIENDPVAATQDKSSPSEKKRSATSAQIALVA